MQVWFNFHWSQWETDLNGICPTKRKKNGDFKMNKYQEEK